MCDSTEKNVCRKYSKESGDGCMESGAPVPGRGKAIASLVLGIVADVFLFITPWVSLVTGLVGLVLACVSKRDGFTGGIRTAGFVVSVVGLGGAGLFLVSCAGCAACAGSTLGTLGTFG